EHAEDGLEARHDALDGRAVHGAASEAHDLAAAGLHAQLHGQLAGELVQDGADPAHASQVSGLVGGLFHLHEEPERTVLDGWGGRLRRRLALDDGEVRAASTATSARGAARWAARRAG